MANDNKEINQLPEATQIDNADLFVLEQSGEAKKLAGSTLKQYATDAGTSAGTTAGTTAAQTVLDHKVDLDENSSLGFAFGCDATGMYIRYEE